MLTRATAPRTIIAAMWKLELQLNDAEKEKLEALARARGKSIGDCLRDFIAACQPGGSGWTHPEKANAPKS